MTRPVRLLVFLGVAAMAAGCDRTPTDAADIAAMLVAADPALANSRALNSTLPALFRESIAKVESANGRRAVDLMLQDWRALQDELKTEAPTASRAAVQAKLDAIHQEELRIVERALGKRVITRLIGDGNVGVAEARAHIIAAEAAGVDLSAARSVADQVEAKLGAARIALQNANSRAALDAATAASTTLAGLRYYLVEGRRIAGLESLLPKAMARLEAGGDRATMEKLATLKAQTNAALRTGDRSAAHERLAELRAEHIRLVLRELGTDATSQLVQDVTERAAEVHASLLSLKERGRDVAKLQRMAREAVDLNTRARAALKKGDAATALDLGSHAAGLLNAVQHLTWN